VLEAKVQDVEVIKDKEVMYKSVDLRLKPNYNILILGTLALNVEDMVWTLKPLFFLTAPSSKDLELLGDKQLFERAYSYVESRASNIKFMQILLVISLILIGVIRRRSIANWVMSGYRWVHSFFVSNVEIEELKEVYALKSDKLKCPCGKTLNVLSACQHLVLCESCYNEHEHERQ
jgi:hypothetical protein